MLQATLDLSCGTPQADAPAARQVGDEWTGETYEEDKEGAFHKFCMSVQHVPQQCIRYRHVSTSHPCLALLNCSDLQLLLDVLHKICIMVLSNPCEVAVTLVLTLFSNIG